jgi:hypothetical protein
MGWFSKILLLGVIGYGGYYVHKLNDAGYLSLPDIPSGAYPISFPNGFRGVVYDMEVTDNLQADAPKIFRRLTLANKDRRFFSIVYDVPEWFEQTWSKCKPGTEDETNFVMSTISDDMKQALVGARLDAICYIELDGEEPLLRGLILSVPA